MHTKFWLGSLKWGDHLEDLDIDGMDLVENSVGRCGLVLSGSG
jgi:hypothetical protein